MNVGGQNFTESVIGRIQNTVNADPDISRRELYRQVCDWLDWYSPAGKTQEMSCRKALAELNRKGAVILPEPKTYGFEKKQCP